MIKKISKLINFGIFHKSLEGTNTPDFKKSNLIYGWNRSGKTTLSRIFQSCEKKCTYDKDKFKRYPATLDEDGNLISQGEFEIKTSDGNTVKSADISTNTLLVKVFNQDFVGENIFFDSDSCNPIIYISEEDIEKKNKIKKLKQDNIQLNENYKQAIKDNFSAEKTKSEFLTNLGRDVSNALFDKTYNKKRAETKINKIDFNNLKEKTLSDEDRENCQLTSRSSAKQKQNPPLGYKFSFSFDGKSINNFQQIFVEVEKLLQKQVISETLGRLKDDPDLNNWVKHGFDLHRSKNEEKKCLFCEKPLDDKFLTTLSKHFSKDYEELQSAINQLKNGLSEITPTLIPAKKDELYPDLKDDYINEAKQLNQCIQETNTWIDSAIEKLQSKYVNPLAVVENPAKPGDFLTLYSEVFVRLDTVIKKHNNNVDNHAAEVSAAQGKIESHLISTALLREDYKKMIANVEKESKKEADSLEAFKKNISDTEILERENSKIGLAIEPINEHLKGFFGREEIKLELDDDKKGYVIKRNEEIAKNLSEGEKTAIAFSYFIVNVGAEGFDKSKGIIFIDDPMSSLDSNFVYHCASMIKEEFKEAGQLFISTHNFQFFNLIKEWFENKNDSKEKDGKTPSCEFFMIETSTDNPEKARVAKISALDKTLLNFRSEYNFLFFKLKKFSENSDVQYYDLYTIGNVARRFCEIFADFKIPKKCNQKAKLDTIIRSINASGEENISPTHREKVYGLINALSHNSDPASGIEHIDKSEVKEVIGILLDIVKKSDPNHYEALEKSLES